MQLLLIQQFIDFGLDGPLPQIRMARRSAEFGRIVHFMPGQLRHRPGKVIAKCDSAWNLPIQEGIVYMVQHTLRERTARLAIIHTNRPARVRTPSCFL
jgi:hypothetical protein